MANRKATPMTIFPSLESFSFSSINIHPMMPQADHTILADIYSRLDAKTLISFSAAVIAITHLHKKQQRVSRPLRRLDLLVANDPQIRKLYNQYARVQVASGSRVTYQLPVYEDLAVGDKEEEDVENASGEEEEDVEEPASEEEDEEDDSAENGEEDDGIEEYQDAMEDIQHSATMDDDVDGDESEKRTTFERRALCSLSLNVPSKTAQTTNDSRDTIQEGPPNHAEQEAAVDQGSPTSSPLTDIADIDMADPDSPCHSRSLKAAGLTSTPDGPPLGFFAATKPTTPTPTPALKKVHFQDENTTPGSPTSTLSPPPSSPSKASPTIERAIAPSTLSAAEISFIQALIEERRARSESTITAAPSSPQVIPARERQRSLFTILADPSSPVRRSPVFECSPSMSTSPAEQSSALQDSPQNGATSPTPTAPPNTDISTASAALPTPDHIDMIPITNPEDFPTRRIRPIQEQRFPSAKVLRLWSHRNVDGKVVKVTGDMQDGPVNHIVIDDARIIEALSLLQCDNDVIEEDEGVFFMDETWNIEIAPTPGARNINTFLTGRLVLARHAYLCWLDRRGTASPTFPPFRTEWCQIAVKQGRREKDVGLEIKDYWGWEHGKKGNGFKNNRLVFLGENPAYTKEQERAGLARLKATSMW